MVKEVRISRELLDGVQDALDKKVVITSAHQFNFEQKADKWESRIVVLSTRRLYILTGKVPTKVESSVHYLDIQGIESTKSNQLRISTSDGRTFYFTSQDADDPDVDLVLTHIGHALRTTFISSSVEKIIKKLEISPAARLRLLTDADAEENPNSVVSLILDRAASGCDGFSRIYSCMCDYYGCTVMDEISWDLDTIYSCKDLHTLRLQDYDHLSPRDHLPLVSALQFSDWFTTLDLAGVKPSSETLTELLRVLKKTTSLKHVNLSSTGLKSDYAQKLSTALLSNVSSTLVSLNLAGNAIDDRGLTHLCGAIVKQPHILQNLNLASTGLTAKGVNQLGKALSECPAAGGTLLTLDLSGNSLKGDELQGLYAFLAQASLLKELNMADTESPVDCLVGALGRGCLQHLELLNVSRDPFTTKKIKEPPATWKQFFQNAQSLKTILLGSTKLPSAAMKALLLGLSANENTLEVALDLSSNELRGDCVNVFGGCIAQLKNVCSLDISDNELDGRLHEILPWFGQNKSLKHLSIGRNFSSLKNRQLSVALDSVVCFLQSEKLALRSLSIADSKLKFDTTVIINALGSNAVLEKIDLSGNQFGDVGAKMLAKALVINSHLKTIYWDRNSVTAHGLEDVAGALERNYFLQDMPLPVMDVASAARAQPEKVQAAVEKMQQSLQRNHGIVNVPLEYSYRLHQSFLVSSTQNVVEEHMSKLKQHSLHDGSFKESPNGVNPGMAQTAQQLKLATKDITNVCQVMNKLLSVAQCQESKPNRLSSQIGEVSKSLQQALDSQIETTVAEMLKSITADYPYFLSTNHDLTSELEAVYKRDCIATGEELVAAVIKHQLEVNVATQLRKKNLQLATAIADSIVDKLLDRLFKQNPKAEQPDVNKHSAGSISEDVINIEQADGADDAFEIVEKSAVEPGADAVLRASESLDNKVSVVTRKSKLYERMRRPQSLVGPSMQLYAVEVEPAIDVDSPVVEAEPNAGVAAAASTSFSMRNDLEEDVTDKAILETEAPIDLDSLTTGGDVGPQLVHVTKDRPRRTKMHMPGRRTVAVPLGSPMPVGSEGNDEDSGQGGEVMDRFFSQSPDMTASVTSSADLSKGQNSSGKTGSLGRSPSITEADSPQIKKKSFWPFGSSSKDKETKEAKKEKEKDDRDKETKESKVKDTKEKDKKSLSNLFGLKKDKKPEGDKVTSSEMTESLYKSADDVNSSSGPSVGGKPPIMPKRTALTVKDIPEKHESNAKGVATADAKVHQPADDGVKPSISLRDIPDPVHRVAEGSKNVPPEAGEEGTGGAAGARRMIGAAAIPGMGSDKLLAEMLAKRQSMSPSAQATPTPAAAPKVPLRPPIPPETKIDSKSQRATAEAMPETDGFVKASPRGSTSTPPATPPMTTLSSPMLPEKPTTGGSVSPAVVARPPKPLPKPKPGSRPNTQDGLLVPDPNTGCEPDGKAGLDDAGTKATGDEQRAVKELAIADAAKELPITSGPAVAAAVAPVPLLRRHKRADATSQDAAESAHEAADKPQSAHSSVDLAGDSTGEGSSAAGGEPTLSRVQSLRRSLLNSAAAGIEQGSPPSSVAAAAAAAPGRLSRPLSSGPLSAELGGGQADE